MTISSINEIFDVISHADFVEVGGSHNQKGIEFQRHWSVLQMFELEEAGEKDFLFLFEAIQDVAILNSCTAPTSICVYQVKKKDRKEWAWALLTNLHQPIDPDKPKKSKKKPHKPKIGKKKLLANIKSSPIGKLYATVIAFKNLQYQCTGRFVSNAGCDLPLADGSNAATSLPCALSELSTHYLDLLSRELETLHETGEPSPDLSCIHLERVALPIDDPGTYLVGHVYKFLEARCPEHAAQARSLVDSLMAKIGPLGAKTDVCKNFTDMRNKQGYSKSEFCDALSVLQSVPDKNAVIENWLNGLAKEGLGFMEIIAIRTAMAAIQRRQLLSASSNDETNLVKACDEWLASHSDPTDLKPFIEKAYDDIQLAFPKFTKQEILANISLRAIKKCVDQT